MRYNFMKLLLVGIVITGVNAKVNVTQEGNMLQVVSDNGNSIITKIIGPDHKIISKEMQKGNMANVVIPTDGKDGVYFYEVHAGDQFKGGMIKIRNGKVVDNKINYRKDRK